MQNSSDTTEEETRSLPFIVVLCLIQVICILLTLSGNILVIRTIWKSPYLREDKSNLLVINLAVLDMLRGFVNMPMTLIATASDVRSIPTTACNLMNVVHVQLLVATLLTLCFISMDRFYAVNRPFKYTQSKNTMMLVAITWTWLQGLFFALVPSVKDWVTYDYWGMICLVQFNTNDKKQYLLVGFTLCCIIPSLIMGFSYSNILYIAQTKFKVVPVSTVTVRSDINKNKLTVQKARAKSAISFVVIVFAFFVSMVPFCALKIIKKSVIPGAVKAAATVFMFLSSVFNPLIYGLLRNDFRNANKNILGKRTTTGIARANRSSVMSVTTSTFELTNSTT